jgi:hypothetical protein
MRVTNWTFAKTYADAPHEYVLQDKEPELYTWYKERLKKEGVQEQFTLRGRTRTYRYLYPGDGYKYWIIGAILNRAKLAK